MPPLNHRRSGERQADLRERPSRPTRARAARRPRSLRGMTASLRSACVWRRSRHTHTEPPAKRERLAAVAATREAVVGGKWGRKDSNLRRLSRRVYSPFPLAARAHPLGRRIVALPLVQRYDAIVVGAG